MKVINLDKFKTAQQVELDGTIYSVSGLTVGMHLNDPDLQKLNALGDGSESLNDRIGLVIAILKKLTNIPEEKLYALQFKALLALFQISQGISPEQVEEDANGSPNA